VVPRLSQDGLQSRDCLGLAHGNPRLCHRVILTKLHDTVLLKDDLQGTNGTSEDVVLARYNKEVIGSA
jgi:hypothetical protein